MFLSFISLAGNRVLTTSNVPQVNNNVSYLMSNLCWKGSMSKASLNCKLVSNKQPVELNPGLVNQVLICVAELKSN